MEKKFDDWNEVKKQVQEESPRLYTVREVWWCRIGINIGSEQDGKGDRFMRPVVIVRGLGSQTCVVVPLTTSTKIHPLRLDVGTIDGHTARANISQLCVVDTRRFVERIGLLQAVHFDVIRKAIRDLF